APRSKQKEAFAFLDRHIFDEPTWLIAEDYMLRLTPTPESYTRSLGTSVMRNLVRYYKLETLTPEYPVAEYLSDITNALFGGARGTKPTAYVRNLQTIFVHTLCSNFNTLQLQTSKSHAAILATLKDLKKRIATMGGDAETRAHYAALVDHIDRTLVIK
ncbi:MAG: zinc-dependent metalloprotease, partial [Bacteroidaceae bacterium]|nr:zinc-dependent metalloprotease [Bacteroidaceae bacterium]